MKHLLITLLLAACTSDAVDDRRDQGADRVAFSRACDPDLSCTVDGELPECQYEYLPTDDQRHVEGEVDYPVYPPAGGAHDRCWWDWGVFTEEVPDERWVHNMEHGGVIFLYNCPDGCESAVADLVDAFSEKDRVIISPYSAMESRFAAVSWEYRTLMDCLDIPHLMAFYRDHFGQGPEDVASMAPSGCMDEVDNSNNGDTGAQG